MPAARPIEYCLITAAFPERGGANRTGWGTYAEMVTRCLREAGVNVTVVLISDAEREVHPELIDDPALVEVRIPWIRYASLVAPGIVEGLVLLRAVRRLDRRHHFDVIEGPNVLGVCWALALTYPFRFILRAHTSLTSWAFTEGWTGAWRQRFRRWLDAVTARRARLVVTHSRAHADTVRSEYRVPDARIVIVPHAVRAPATSEPGSPSRLLAIINAAPRKGADLLLRAFAGARRRHPEAELVVVGCSDRDISRLAEPGPGEADPVDTSGVLGLGPLSDELLEAEWRRAGVVLVPSRYESFGLVAVEAMARGKVVIAADGGALGAVTGSGGLVVNANSVEALQRAIDDVLASEELRARLVAAGRARYQQLYRPEMLSVRLMTLIQSLQQSGRRARAQ